MKHLKTYKVFESSSEDSDIVLDIRDILFELDDYDGIEYHVKNINYYKDDKPYKPYPSIRVEIKDNKYGFFRLEDIMDVLLRLKDYLKETNYDIDMGYSGDYYPIDDFIDEFDGEELPRIHLFIYKH